ncbi:centrosomal protein CCDC61-like [Diceros bicornis minor]|uniref:centrosomal protein CCDC61-like n=1 Tax=Diceros bicornis minor TaxID=77932 RepID=UPI0026F2F4A7|nr:centrosomal protein CCDC61-like [Diceros bicornis minor]
MGVGGENLPRVSGSWRRPQEEGRRTPPVVSPAAREDRASSSRERSTSRGRGAARSSSRDSGRGGRGRGRAARPSPSPTGGRVPGFDPTAFVKAKEKQQREIKMKGAPTSPCPAHIPAPLPGPLTCALVYPRFPPVSIACHLLHLSPSPYLLPLLT